MDYRLLSRHSNTCMCRALCYFKLCNTLIFTTFYHAPFILWASDIKRLSNSNVVDNPRNFVAARCSDHVNINDLKSPVSGLFVQPFVNASIKEDIEAAHHGPLVKGIHRWPVVSPYKWPVKQKTFLYHNVTMRLFFSLCNSNLNYSTFTFHI